MVNLSRSIPDELHNALVDHMRANVITIDVPEETLDEPPEVLVALAQPINTNRQVSLNDIIYAIADSDLDQLMQTTCVLCTMLSVFIFVPLAFILAIIKLARSQNNNLIENAVPITIVATLTPLVLCIFIWCIGIVVLCKRANRR